MSTPQDRARAERSYMVRVGQRVRHLREEQSMTQQELARRAGVAADMVSRLENGRYTSPGLRTLLRLAQGLGVGVPALLPEHPAPAASARNAQLGPLLQHAHPADAELVFELARVVLRRRSAH